MTNSKLSTRSTDRQTNLLASKKITFRPDKAYQNIDDYHQYPTQRVQNTDLQNDENRTFIRHQ